MKPAEFLVIRPAGPVRAAPPRPTDLSSSTSRHAPCNILTFFSAPRFPPPFLDSFVAQSWWNYSTSTRSGPSAGDGDLRLSSSSPSSPARASAEFPAASDDPPPISDRSQNPAADLLRRWGSSRSSRSRSSRFAALSPLLFPSPLSKHARARIGRCRQRFPASSPYPVCAIGPPRTLAVAQAWPPCHLPAPFRSVL